MKRIAVIGAGCSGITAVKMLAEEGLTNIVCFEKNSRIGGNWVYSEQPGHSSVCETTHLISSKWLSHYADFPMPAEYPDYPAHQQVLAYFEDYARRFGVEQYIRFNTEVLRAEKTADARWQLQLSDGRTEVFDYLLVANGHHSDPRHPEWKNDFTGRYLHSHDYKNNRGFEQQRVLVVGAGNSGCDCAVEISRVAARVELSVRSPQYIIPKFFLGKPTDTFAKGMLWAPDFLKNILHRLSVRIQVGRYRDYGLPEPSFPPTYSHPTVNSELLDKIRHGKVHPRPGIRKVEGRNVHFTDGTVSEYDTIVAATGFRIRFPFFDPAFIHWENATNIPLYLRVFHPEHEGLFFIGLVQPQGSVWPLSEAQSRLVARVISGKVHLPANWREQASREGLEIERTFMRQPRHSTEVHFHPYLQKLEKMSV